MTKLPTIGILFSTAVRVVVVVAKLVILGISPLTSFILALREALVAKLGILGILPLTLYISYTLGLQLRNVNTNFTLGNCLFGSVKLTKNADPDKYKYSGYGIGFDSRSEFLFTDGSYGKNVIYTIMEATVSYLLMPQKYISSKQIKRMKINEKNMI